MLTPLFARCPLVSESRVVTRGACLYHVQLPCLRPACLPHTKRTAVSWCLVSLSRVPLSLALSRVFKATGCTTLLVPASLCTRVCRCGGLFSCTDRHTGACTHTRTHTHMQQAAEELARSLGLETDLKLPPVPMIDLPAVPPAPFRSCRHPAPANPTVDASPSAVCSGEHSMPHASSCHQAVRPVDADGAHTHDSGEAGRGGGGGGGDDHSPAEPSGVAEGEGATCNTSSRTGSGAFGTSMHVASSLEAQPSMHMAASLQPQPFPTAPHSRSHLPPAPPPAFSPPATSDTSSADEWASVRADVEMARSWASMQIDNERMRQARAAEARPDGSTLRRYNVPVGRCLG